MFGDTSFERRSEWFEAEVLRTVSLQLTERIFVRIIPPYTRMPVDVRSPKAPLAGDTCGVRIGTQQVAICAPRGMSIEPLHRVVRAARRCAKSNVGDFATRCGSRLFDGLNLAAAHVPVQYRLVTFISTLHVTLALSHSVLPRA